VTGDQLPVGRVLAGGAIALSVVLVSGSLAPGVAASPPPAPNILLIVTDDQRAAADTLSVMSSTASAFEQQGTNFPNYMVTTPLCCPARSTIFSGRYAHNTGVLTNTDAGDVQAFDQRATIQAYLHGAGYQTGIAGKFFNTWPVAQDPPNFDRWAIFSGGYTDPTFNVDGTVQHLSGYSTSVLTDRSVDMLDGFESKDADPWFLYVAPQAPHSPFTPDTPYLDAAVPPWRPGPAFDERGIGDKPPWVRWRTYSLKEAKQLRAGQLRTLMSVDDMVRRIFEELDALGETSDTLAIFTSDNGLLWGEHRIGDQKRFPYTESVSVPFLMRWPGHIPAGVVDDRAALSVDILPTILDATGVTPSLVYPLDGRSLLGSTERRRVLLEYWKSSDYLGVPTWASIRGSSFQYIEWYDDEGIVTFREYYDLRKDPYELRNLLHDGDPGNDPDTSGLAQQVARARRCVGDRCP
jgi:arylsulfatase A-like enzyme